MNNSRGFSYGVQHFLVPELKPTKPLLVDFLSHETAESEERITQLISLGAVYINHRRTQNLDCQLRAGDYVRAHLKPRRYAQPPGLRERIVQSHDDFLIIDKPAGLPVHAMVDNAQENLLSFLQEQLGHKFFITHRLDVGTSGLIIVAKTTVAQSRINALLMKKKIRRTYLAWAMGKIANSTYIHYMERSPVAPKKVFTDNPNDTRLRCEMIIHSAVNSSLEEIESFWRNPIQLNFNDSTDRTSPRGLNLVSLTKFEIELSTGRTQQIRAQLSQLGHPILGDEVYGSPFELLDAKTTTAIIALRAHRIDFL